MRGWLAAQLAWAAHCVLSERSEQHSEAQLSGEDLIRKNENRNHENHKED